jgi:hypothetical protein
LLLYFPQHLQVQLDQLVLLVLEFHHLIQMNLLGLLHLVVLQVLQDRLDPQVLLDLPHPLHLSLLADLWVLLDLLLQMHL